MYYIVFSIPILLYFVAIYYVSHKAIRQKATGDGDYFLAGRSIGTFQAMLSVVATETSVATIVVFPSTGYKEGFTVMWLAAGYILGRIIVARFFLEKLYRSEKLSIYAEMTGRSGFAHDLLSGFYLLAKFISSGVRFYMGGFALDQLFGGGAVFWMLVMAISVGIYSLTGGLKAVVLTGQIQGYIILFMGVALVIFFLVQNPWSGNISFTHFFYGSDQAVPLYDFNMDLSNGRNSIAYLLGGIVLSIGTHAADQDMIQRVLGARSLEKAKMSILASGPAAAFVIFLYTWIGVLLVGRSDDLKGVSPLVDAIGRFDHPFLSGLFAVLLVAAAMSTLDAVIHSTGAIWKTLFRSHRSGWIWSTLSLGVLILFGIGFIPLSNYYKDFLSLAMGSMNYINGGLIGIIVVYTFQPRRISAAGVAVGLLWGFIVAFYTTWLAPIAFAWSVITVLSALAGWCGVLLGSLLPERMGGKKRDEGI